MRRASVQRLLTIGLLLTAARVDAHDSWLIAEHNVKGGCGSLRVAFVTSEEFPKSEHATKPERVAEWVVVGPEGRRPVNACAMEGLELVARPEIQPPGLFAVGVTLAPNPIEMPYEKFEAYLEGEKADSALRVLRGDDPKRSKPQRELYTKFGKTFVEVQPETADIAALPPLVGHKLEIQPTSDPCMWSAGREIEVQVLLDGRPAAHQRLSSGHEGTKGHAYVQSVTTDSRGMAALKFDRPGLWFVRTHLIRLAEGEAAKSADWQSWWASITFRVSEAPPAAVIFGDVRAIHGSAGPWAVAGYRMGSRALRELGLKRGSFDLEVIHETPMRVQYSCIADGIQAATGASAGKLNLKLKEVEPDGLRTIFRKKSTGETCVIELSGSARSRMMDVPLDLMMGTSRAIAELPDAELMTVHRAEETCHTTTQQAGAK